MNIIEFDYGDAKDHLHVYLLGGHAQKVYVEAWKGVGATALLREVAEAVETSEERQFDTVIKAVRPAPFRNRREIQRAVAKQLLNPLPHSVTAAFDAKDEDDDFGRKEFSSRDDLLSEVTDDINRAVEGRKVLLVLCNNIADAKLIAPTQLPNSIIGRWIHNAVLWTCGMNISREAASASAEYIFSIKPSNKEAALDLVYKEVVEIARYIDESSGGSLRPTPQIVLRCFWYCLLLCRAFNRSALLDDGRALEAVVKYFVCDGILQGDAAWEIGRALAPVLIGCMVNDQLLQYWDETFSAWTPSASELLPPKTLLIDSITHGDMVKLSSPSEEEESYRWISVRSPQTNNPEPWDFFFKAHRSSVVSDVSSFFAHFEKKTHEALPDGFFDHFSNVRVLDLLGCVVSPINSSFLRLRNLRMLRLERCKVTSLDPNSHSSAPEGRREPILFDNLWVLNLYNLEDANTFLLGGEAFELMPNLRVLDLTDCEGLEYLSFNLPATIETISLQSCASLKEVELVVDRAAAPFPNLKTFRLSGSKLIAKLSLKGCRKLENVDLQELMALEVLDLSCTAIKVVDIRKLQQLKQLFLLGCEQLRRVVCLEEGQKLDVLYLDNYNSGSACDVDRCLDSFRNQRLCELTKGADDADQRLFHAHVVVRDVRLFRSLYYAFLDSSREKSCFHIHVKGSSTIERGVNIGTTTRSNATITSALCYADVLNTMTDRHRQHHPSPPTMPLNNHIEVDGGHDSRIVEEDVLNTMTGHHRRHHPSPPTMPLNNHIEVDGGHDSRIVEEDQFGYIMRFANSLFIHDNMSNFTMGIEFGYLKCFRIERCPNLEFIFSCWIPQHYLMKLESTWLSQLPRLKALREGGWINTQLKHIYLEFCARLEYVFSSLSALHDLETINICYCGNLTAIFIDDEKINDERVAAPKLLPNLKSIHLQELPKLQHIYKPNICAPSLEELKIKGCFNLRKLPLFGRSDARSMRAVKISCEKDWWDKLQWDDGLESNHHSSLFNPKHCPYYKKPMKATYL